MIDTGFLGVGWLPERLLVEFVKDLRVRAEVRFLELQAQGCFAGDCARRQWFI